MKEVALNSLIQLSQNDLSERDFAKRRIRSWEERSESGEAGEIRDRLFMARDI